MKDLDEMLKKELIELAEELGIEDLDGTKAVLIERIQAKQEALLALESDEEPEVEEEVLEEEAVEEEVVEEVVEEKVVEENMLDLLTDEPDETADNKEFIEWAYLHYLERKADDGGLMHYLNGMKLRNWSRDRIKDALANSDEAKALAELKLKSK